MTPLAELQRAVANPRRGYDIHHIVEKTDAARFGIERDLIDGPDNLVQVPTLKHWQITGWFMVRSGNYGGMSPRDYLKGKDWEERRRVGLEALRIHGVIEP